LNETWIFWALAGVMGLAVAGVLARSLRPAGADTTTESSERPDLAIYRDQLAEVERDLARGVLGADEAARLRVEVSRRLLDADRQAQARGSRGPGLPAVVLILLALGGAGATYWHLGAPGYPDLSLATRIAAADDLRLNRPTQAEAEAEQPAWTDPQMDAETADLMAQLRAAVAARPEDAQGLEFLRRYEAELGNFRAAAAAQSRLVALMGDSAGASDRLALADLLIRAAQGYVSPEAEAQLTAILTDDPENGLARYYSGLLLAQVGRPDLAFRLWERLLADSPSDAPWLTPLQANIAAVAAEAGVSYDGPALPGPTEADVDAAAQMSAEDQQAFIRSMVDGLEERLRSQGGTAEEWARLIKAYGVLGDTSRQSRTRADAERIFAGDTAALALIQGAMP
jgi:cytochrome c-type biogenesis protein CcmH